MHGRGRHAFLELEPAVAIGTFDEAFVSHIEEDAWVATCPTIAVTGDLCRFYNDDFGWFYGHLILSLGD